MLKQMAEIFLRFLIFLSVLAAIGGVALWVNWDTGAVAYYRTDYVVAMKAYKPLAEKGCVDAQSKIGEMYRKGWGVPQSDVEEKKWRDRSAAQGFTHSRRLYPKCDDAPGS